MCTIRTSKTEEIRFDGKVLSTPMNVLSETLGLSSYIMEDSTSVYSAKTQEPLIDIVKSQRAIPSELVTFSRGKLNRCYVLAVQDLDDDKVLVTVLDTLESDHGERERFIGYLIYTV